ncbi:hypothetical protein ACET3Z_015012 [Daucus carota]
MGELNNQEDPSVNHTFPPKRKPEEQDALIHSDSATKKPKPEALLESKVIETKVIETKVIEEQHIEDEDTEEDEEEYEEEEEDEDDDEENSNGEAEVDVKGKGIMKEDKGKGKLIEESEDDEDDSSDGAADVFGSDDESDSDLSEDPLAEVDLDNILPSRTRSRRGASRGVVIGNSDDKDNDDE